MYNNTFQCTLKLTVGYKNLFIFDHKTFSYEEIDKVLSILKTVMDETNNIIKVSNAFVDSLQPVGNEKSYTALVNEFSSHFKANYGKTKYYHGLIYSLSICLNDSLDLRVCVELASF